MLKKIIQCQIFQLQQHFGDQNQIFQVGAKAWILAGGAHHTAFSYDLTSEQLGDWATAMGIEVVYIDKNTNIKDFKNELRWNEIAYR